MSGVTVGTLYGTSYVDATKAKDTILLKFNLILIGLAMFIDVTRRASGALLCNVLMN